MKTQRNYLADSFMTRYDLYSVQLQDLHNSAALLPSILRRLVMKRREVKERKGSIEHPYGTSDKLHVYKPEVQQPRGGSHK